MIRIAALNTCFNGSTGRIMLGIAKTTKDNQFEYKCFAPKSKNNPKIDEKTQVYFGTYLETALCTRLAKITGLNGCFSYFNTFALIRLLNKYKPDIIHLHNLHDCYINFPILFRYLGKRKIKIVWTLHDCWSFTGGCTYYLASECKKWLTDCKKCPGYSYPCGNKKRSSYILNLKRKYISFIDNLTVVSPSKWLENEAKFSFLKKYEIITINNGIDIEKFFRKQNSLRDFYLIKNKFVLLGVASPWNYRKGIDLIIELSKKINNDLFVIILVGTDEALSESLPSNIISVKKTNSLDELVDLYSIADVLINPTREDNFPTVNIEALACGVPVITFNSGGSAEAIDKKTGIVTKEKTVEALYYSILEIYNNPLKREDCVYKSKEYDSLEAFKKYTSLYKKISR